MTTELTIDQQGKAETEQNLERDRPEHKVRRRLHRLPDIGIAQDAAVVVETDVADRRVRSVRAEIRERELERPQQRENVDCQQQQHRGCNEQPCDGPVRQTADAPGDPAGRAGCDLLRNRRDARRLIHAAKPARSRMLPWRAPREHRSPQNYILPSSWKTFVQSLTKRSSASCAEPLSATT